MMVPVRAGTAAQGLRPDPPPTHEWRLIETPALPGARNMAIDLALIESVRAGGARTLRFYRWWPPCISLGRNQTARGHYDLEEAGRRGIEFVRRPTGGRAVYHHHEITYSVITGDRSLGGPRQTYRKIHRALVAGLRLLGVRADTAEQIGAALPPTTLPCFRELDGGAIIADGRKLVGSAQLRESGILLQHGSILLGADQAPAGELLRIRREGDPGPRVAALGELLPRLPDWKDLVDTLAVGFERVLGIRLSDSELGPDEHARAEGHVQRFTDPEWTWRN